MAFRRVLLVFHPPSSTPPRRVTSLSILAVHQPQFHYTTALAESSAKDQSSTRTTNNKNKGTWFTLPPYTSTNINGAALGKALSASSSASAAAAATQTTALKWVLRCCPQLPRNLVQKLFRLRQVRKESSILGDQAHEQKPKRVNQSGPVSWDPALFFCLYDSLIVFGRRMVAAKDTMKIGDRIFLPITVQELPSEERNCHYDEEEVEFIQKLVLYKDPAIIVVNKPPGMPVQGGIGIKRSLDEVVAACLSYDYTEPPRLVHRLDRDCSGLLVMGRMQTSTALLHSIFREKTVAAAIDDNGGRRRILQRKYWALVIGFPRRPTGLISAPLGKVVVDNGKSERITVVENAESMSSQHAVTKYRVIESSPHGYSWLELSPLTGRKHQLRVHCAYILGTPIVGDYKYGWQAHRKWKILSSSDPKINSNEKQDENRPPFGLDLENGSISGRQPRLHLHCQQMVLPDVSQALQHVQMPSDSDFSQLDNIELDAPLPSHMQKSWDILSFRNHKKLQSSH